MITVQELNYNEENFNWWLTIMPDVLMNLSLLPQDVRDSLNFSVESLLIFEEYILENYTLNSIREKNNKRALDVFTRYIGETFRKNLKNVIWSFQDNPKFIDYGYPILIKRDNQPFTPQNPASFIVAALDRKKGNYLIKILKNNIENEIKWESQKVE